jgi:hypothetical protein
MKRLFLFFVMVFSIAFCLLVLFKAEVKACWGCNLSPGEPGGVCIYAARGWDVCVE